MPKSSNNHNKNSTTEKIPKLNTPLNFKKSQPNHKMMHEEKSEVIYGIANFVTRKFGSTVNRAMQKPLVPFCYTVLK